MRGIPRLIVLLLALSMASAAWAQEDPRPALAIVDARVVLSPTRTLPVANVVIRDGIITAVGPEAPVPHDARRIKGKGRVVYAGFIDGLTHSGYEFGKTAEKVAKGRSELGWDRKAQVPVGMDPARRNGIWATRQVYRNLVWDGSSWSDHRKHGFTAGLIAPKGGFVAGRSAIVSYSGALPRHALLGYDNAQHIHLDFRQRGYPSTVMGTLAYLRQLFSDARWHAQAWQIYRKSGQKGLRRPPLDQELMAINTSSYFIFHAQTENEIHRAIGLAEEYGLRAGIAGGRFAYKTIERLQHSKVPVILSLAWPEPPKDPDAKPKKTNKKPSTPTPAKPTDRPAKPPTPKAKADTPKAKPVPRKRGKGRKRGDDGLPPKRAQRQHFANWKEEVRCAIALQKAGIPFVFSTEGIGPQKALERVQQLIGWGLPAKAALTALTTRPASLYLGNTTLGRVQVGGAAHLLVCSGTLGKKLQVQQAIVDGRLFTVADRGGPSGKPLVDLSGQWKLSSSSSFGTFTGTATVIQAKNGKLSGKIVSRFGTAKITQGKVGGKQFVFTAAMPFGKQTLSMEFSGSLIDGQINGTATFSWDGKTRDFTAVRPKEHR